MLPILGSISLVLIGLKLGLSGLSASNNVDPRTQNKPSPNGMLRGFIIHVSNPNTFIFFLSIFLSIVPIDKHYIRNLVLLGTIAVLVDLVVLTNYALLSQKVSSYVLSGKSVMRHTPILSAIMLLFLGLQGVVAGIQTVLK